MASVDACPVTGVRGSTTVRPTNPAFHSERNPAMIIGDLVVLLVTVVPVVLTVLSLRADPNQLVGLFGPAVR
jgi:hypothetical protein